MSDSAAELLSKYSVSIEQVREWAKPRYARFLSNDTLITRLYLMNKGVKFTVPFTVSGPIVQISELEVSKSADIEVAVVQHLDSRTYTGCPDDMKKIKDATVGKETECSKCGKIVVPVKLTWHRYLVGDTTSEIILSVPPSAGAIPNEGQVIIVEGVLGENEEFSVYRWKELGKDDDSSSSGHLVVVESQQPTSSSIPSPSNGESTSSDIPVSKTPDFKCEKCGKILHDKRGLSIHNATAHKDGIKKVVVTDESSSVQPTSQSQPSNEPSTSSPPTNPPTSESSPSTESQHSSTVQISNDVLRYCKVAGMIGKDEALFRKEFSAKYPKVDVDAALKESKVVVNDSTKKLMFAGG